MPKGVVVQMNNYTFFPLAFRMKYINRWGLMRNTQYENLLEHSSECAILAHALALIGNTYFNKSYNADSVALKALYHDISEIYTGDLPTPVKYHNKDISSSYKDIEKNAINKLISRLPEELKSEYEKALDHEENECEKVIIKAADKLCALIKCIEELANGNREFLKAEKATRESLNNMTAKCPELAYFMEHFLPEFEKSLDDL